MKTKALAMALTGAILFAGSGKAESLEELRTRLSALRNDQPVRLVVDVTLEHRGSAPLHLNKNRRRGTAKVQFGPEGAKVVDEKWLKDRTFASLWRSAPQDEHSDMPLVDFEVAREMADPAGALSQALDGAVVVEDRTDTWHEQTVRLLVLRPAELPAQQEDDSPFVTEMKIWLGPDGIPLGMEKSFEFKLGPALKAMERMTFTYQQVGGRLLAEEVRDDFQGSAIGVLRNKNKRTMKVRVEG